MKKVFSYQKWLEDVKTFISEEKIKEYSEIWAKEIDGQDVEVLRKEGYRIHDDWIEEVEE
jgi:hypothetical protein